MVEVECHVEYRGYTVRFERENENLWRADVFVGDVLVWPVYDATRAKARARAVHFGRRPGACCGVSDPAPEQIARKLHREQRQGLGSVRRDTLDGLADRAPTLDDDPAENAECCEARQKHCGRRGRFDAVMDGASHSVDRALRGLLAALSHWRCGLRCALSH